MSVSPNHSLTLLVEDYRRQLVAHGQRGLVVLSGMQDWCRQQAVACLSVSAGANLWLGEEARVGIECLPAADARRFLGRERDDVIFDGWSGMDPDALAAISGSVRAGHILFLLIPPFDAWPDFDDPEHQRILVSPYTRQDMGHRFISLVSERLQTQANILRLEQGAALPSLPNWSETPTSDESVDSPCRTLDQQRAVEALEHVVNGHRRRPLVLLSDRGRGKSSALGLAAAKLLQSDPRSIIVTAPSLASSEVIFQRLEESLPGADVAAGRIRWQGGEVRFMAPDELLHEAPQADLVMVDEAAAIPASILEGLLRQHSRIAFATTVHGYEGTGRGFEIRFKQRLQELTPDWKALRLSTPIRWRDGDPLEQAIFSMLMLDVEMAELTGPVVEGDTWRIEHVDRDRLWRDQDLLAQCFGLLINAHYRTRPYDLRHLLDGPNVELFIMRQGAEVIGVAATVLEGKTGAEMEQSIYEGKRRLHGHLLPQSLLAHAGARQALDYSYLRVMRIAIHPQRQRAGLGSALVDFLDSWARERGMDFIGASFAASLDMLSFWTQSGMQAVRIGFKRERASGSHTVMMLKPLDLRAEAYHEGLRGRFIHELPYLLAEPLQSMETELVPWLLQAEHSIDLSEPQRVAITDFISGWRDYEAVLPELWHFVAVACSHWRRLDSEEKFSALVLLIEKIWQRKEMSRIANDHSMAGRRAVLKQLRSACALLME